MSKLTVKNISSLEKVLPAAECDFTEVNSGSALLNEEFSYQVAYKGENEEIIRQINTVEVESDISEYIKLYVAKGVPVTFRDTPKTDKAFENVSSAVIPDVLEPYNKCLSVSLISFRTLWVSVKADKKVKPGKHRIKIIFKSNGEETGISEFELSVIGAELPELDIPNTNWIHADCIADIHNCKIFSARHWKLIDKYIKMASDHGVNMMYTPVVTPALDTQIGIERPTVQLVDIALDKGKYTFGFEKLEKWLKLCRKNKIKYIEVAHLFSQWGGKKTPKVVVKENGREYAKFGWHTDALTKEYKEFLKQFVPALAGFFEEKWDREKVYFHLTDEPETEHLDHYGELYKLVKPLLGNFKQMDALSDYVFYEKGIMDTPVVITPKIMNYVNNGVENMWAYTCSWPYDEKYGNRFIEMPSCRSRITGLQLYKYNIKGFLHWGFNFYYSRLSVQLINPYINNDAEGGFPAGDGFSVYPVFEGVIPSIRLKVFNQGMQDFMAAKLLERLAGREEVMKIIERCSKIEFDIPPKNAEYVLKIREEINKKIAEIQ